MSVRDEQLSREQMRKKAITRYVCASSNIFPPISYVDSMRPAMIDTHARWYNTRGSLSMFSPAVSITSTLQPLHWDEFIKGGLALSGYSGRFLEARGDKTDRRRVTCHVDIELLYAAYTRYVLAGYFSFYELERNVDS